MAKSSLKCCSKLLAFREMEIKVIMIFHYKSIQTAKIKRLLTKQNPCQSYGTLNHSDIVMGI